MTKTWLDRLVKNPVLLSSLLLTVAYNLANFLHFLANFMLVKALPVDLYGEYASTVAYVGLLSIPLSIFALIVIQKVGRQADQSRQQYLALLERRFGQTLKKYWWLVGVAGGAIVFWLMYWSNLTMALSVVYIIVALVLSVLTSFYGACLQGEKNFKAYSATLIIGAVIKMAGYALLLFFWASLPVAYLFLVVSNVVVIMWQRRIAFWGATRRSGVVGANRRSDGSDRARNQAAQAFNFWRLLSQKEIWLSVVAMLGVMALINMDLILVKKFLTPDDAGLYGVISLLAKTVNYALLPITQVIFAFGASRETAKDNEKHINVTALFFLVCGLVATVIYAGVPNIIINVVAKPDYLVVAPDIWLAGIFGTLYTLATLYAQYFINKKSLVALWAVPWAMAQALGIYWWHQSFTLILAIDVAVAAVIVAGYGLVFAGRRKRRGRGERSRSNERLRT